MIGHRPAWRRSLVLVLELLLALPLLAHPVSDCFAELERDGDDIIIRLHFTLDDVYLMQAMVPDEDMHFARTELRTGLAAHRADLLAGLRLYDRDGTILTATDGGLSGTLPERRPHLDHLVEYRFVLRLIFEGEDGQVPDAVGFDFGAWRWGVTTSLACHYLSAGPDAARVLWQERNTYPLFPSGGRVIDMGGEPIRLVDPVQAQRIGYSYLYIQADHVRHELLLPIAAVVDRLPPEEVPPSTGLLDLPAREKLAARLVQDLQALPGPDLDGSPSAPQKGQVRWFTRGSLRQGLPVGAVALPVATAFVGLLMEHRPADGRVDHCRFATAPWRPLADELLCTLLVDGQVEQRVPAVDIDELVWHRPTPPATGADVTGPTAANDEHPLPVSSAEPGWWLAATCAAIAAILAFCTPSWRGRCGWMLVAGVGLFLALQLRPRSDPVALTAERLTTQLRQCYQAATMADAAEALATFKQAVTDELVAEFFLTSRTTSAGPWASRRGSRVTAIQVTAIEPAAEGLDRGRCSWEITGRIEHWGHVHHRRIRLTAQIALDRHGRLAELRLLNKVIVETDSRPVADQTAQR